MGFKRNDGRYEISFGFSDSMDFVSDTVGYELRFLCVKYKKLLSVTAGCGFTYVIHGKVSRVNNTENVSSVLLRMTYAGYCTS